MMISKGFNKNTKMYTHPLEEKMATNSSTLAWIIPWTEEPGRLGSGGHKESDTTEVGHTT